MVKIMEPIPSPYDLASSATSVLLLNLVEEVASGYPLVETTSTPTIGGDVLMGADAGHPPRLDEEPSDLSQSSRTATLNESGTWMQDPPLGSTIHGLNTFNSAASLARQNTLLATGSSPHRNARELKTILGSANAKLKRDSSLPLNSNNPMDLPDDTSVLRLEGANARARVRLDLILENDTCVQGGSLNGFILLTVRKKGDELVMLSEGKMRVIGFESIMHEKERAAFYEYSVPLSSICQNLGDLYLVGPNDDGFMLVDEGQFTLPFSLYLDPEATSSPPKGSFPPHSGVALRYILMASIRVKDPISDDKSLAHFYRHIKIWPRWDLALCLTPLPRPIQVTMSGLEGNLKLSIILQRLQWFAGQPCHLKFYVVNNTSKPIKTLTVELHRDTITCRPRGDPAVTDDFGESETSMTSKLLLVSSLSAGDRAEKGYASARGWWTGVHAGESLHFYHALLLPPDALSVAKGRLLEIEYRVKATISSGNLLPTELSAEVPIRIINFISVDPPPSQANATPALMSRSSAASNVTQPGPPYSAILAATLDPGSGGMRRGESGLNTRELVVPPPMMDLDSERSRSYAGRFADLYYQGLQEDLIHQGLRDSRSAKGYDDLTTENPSVPNNPPEMNVLQTQTSMYSQGTFQTRNAEPGHLMESSIPVGGVLPPSVSFTGTPASDRTRNESSNGRTLSAPKVPILDIAPSPKKLPSRDLPEPPSFAASKALLEERVPKDSSLLPISSSRPASPLPPRGTPSVTPSGSQSAYCTTSFPLSPGAVSVKDKIRELEERVKAIESSATTPT